MRRRKPSDLAAGIERPNHHAPQTTKLLASLPNLIEHLTVTRYDDGAPRKPGRVFLEVLGVNWVVVMKEPDDKLEMRCVGATVDDALVLADLMLGADDPPWVPDDWARDQPAKKRR